MFIRSRNIDTTIKEWGNEKDYSQVVAKMVGVINTNFNFRNYILGVLHRQ